MEERADSGIVVDYFDVFHHPHLDHEAYLENCFYENHLMKEGTCCITNFADRSNTTSLIELFNYINPKSKLSDRQVVISVIENLLSNDDFIFHQFRSSNLALNNLTRCCSLEVINKFEELSIKIHRIIEFIDDRIDSEFDVIKQIDHITFYTYLTSLRKLINKHVLRVILQIDEQIERETIEFKSLWHFYQHMNSANCGHLIDKVCILNTINQNINQSDGEVACQADRLINNRKLITILDQLYLNLKFPTNQNRYLWILFMNCLKPTLKYLQDFLDFGISLLM